MRWRILAVVAMLVGVLYGFHTQPRDAAKISGRVQIIAKPADDKVIVASTDNPQPENVSFAPIDLPALPQISVTDLASSGATPAKPETAVTLDILLESRQIAEATGLLIGAVQLSDKLPEGAPMAMNFRHDECLLLLSNSLPLEGMKITGLSNYGKRLLVFALGHEIGHCYVLTHILAHDPAILPTLSPPGRAYRFDEYAAMIGKYSDYPDLNRWNEEWADAFSIFALAKVYGKEYGETVANEVYSIRKDQEKNGGVQVANVYGGHASLAEKSLLTIQSPLDIASVVKLGRLNTKR